MGCEKVDIARRVILKSSMMWVLLVFFVVKVCNTTSPKVTNVTLSPEDSEDLLTNHFLKLLLLDDKIRPCSLVVGTSQEMVSLKVASIIHETDRSYQPLVTSKMTSFNFSWKNYPGIQREEEMFSFRTMPPELKSTVPAGYSGCSLIALTTSDRNTLRQLLIHIAHQVSLRNIHDYVWVHLKKASDIKKLLLDPPCDGIRNKVLTVYENIYRHIVLYDVCFFCNKGQPIVSRIGALKNHETTNTFQYSEKHNYGSIQKHLPEEVYQDTASVLNGRRLKVTFLVDLNMEAIRRRKDVMGSFSLLFHESILLNIEDALDARLDVDFPSNVNLGVESRLPNGTWIGTAGEILAGRADFSIVSFPTDESVKYTLITNPMMFIRFGFLTRAPRLLIGWRVVFKPFDRIFWWILILCSLISAIALHRVSDSSLLWCIQHVLRLYVEQPLPLTTNKSSPRYISGCLLLFSIVVVCGYKSKLMACLTSPPQEDIPETFQNLLTSKFSWGFSYFTSLIFDAVIKEAHGRQLYDDILNKSQSVYTIEDCFEESLRRHYACISVEYIVRRFQVGTVDGRGRPLFTMAPNFMMSFYSSPAISRSSVYSARLHNIADGFFQSGLLSKWEADDHFSYFITNLFKVRRESSFPSNRRLLNEDVFGLNDMAAIFAAWVLGLLFSCIVLSGELLMGRFKTRTVNVLL